MAELHLEKTNRSSKKTKKERKKLVMNLRPAMTKLEADDEIV